MNKSYPILLLEDESSVALGIITRLKQNQDYVMVIDWVDNCDDAFKALQEKEYAVFISDLSIEDDEKQFKIKSGEDLIIRVKKLPNRPKIVVYSMYSQAITLDLIINNIGVEGYVIKGRNGLNDLALSLPLILSGNYFYSKKVHEKLQKFKETLKIDRLDRSILRYLYRGHIIKNLPRLLKEDGFKATSQASIENRIKMMKDYFCAQTTTQLVAIAREKNAFID